MLAAGLAFLVPPSERDPLIVEHGLVENGTVVLYAIAAAWLLADSRIERALAWCSTGILALCSWRELDGQKAFTSDSMTKSSYYLDSSIPLSERLVVAVLVVLMVLLIVLYIRRYWRPFAAALRAREAFAYSIAAAIVLGPVSKLLDGAHRMTEDLTGETVSEETRMQLMAVEETLEFGIPLLVLWACAQFALLSREAAAHRLDPVQGAHADLPPRR